VDALSLFLYRALGALALAPALALPVLRGRFGARWGDRLGYTLAGGGRPLWLHGSSVGEAGSCLQLLQALRELGLAAPAVVSAATPAGLSFLEARLQNPRGATERPAPSLARGSPGPYGRTQIAAPPLDFLGAPGRFLDRLDPLALLVIETEIWPELFLQCHRRGVPVLLVSARLSRRSHRRMSFFRGFLGGVLKDVSLVAAIGRPDLGRLVDLGVRPELAALSGSPKFDRLIAQARATLSAPSGPSSRGPAARPLVLAGSTHPGEEELILDACLGLPAPGADLAIAPRHLGRVPAILGLARSRGLVARTFSETGSLSAGPGSVAVIDQMGRLSGLYRECDLAIVGGSFLSGSGHNPLEPAAAGKPVIYGPHMSSFRAEAEELESLGAAKAVPPGLLPAAMADLLSRPDQARRAGRAGLELLAARPPVAPRLARAIMEFLASPGPQGQRLAMGVLGGCPGPGKPPALPGP
jgi:3-deoxy-D-manno-octulosonic-acid transferase